MTLRNLFSAILPGLLRLDFGGGGGGGGQAYYENQDKLLGVQADIAQGIYNNIYQPYAPGAVADLDRLRKEVDPAQLEADARAKAAADSGEALTQSMGAVQRGLGRYGMDPNRLAHEMTTAGLQGAAMKAGNVNAAGRQARQFGQQQEFARTQDFYNALSGIPSQASSSLGSAASGYGQMAAGQNQNDQANAAGYGQFGGRMAGKMFADGGSVKKYKKVAYMAGGGLTPINWRGQSTAGSRYPSAPNPVMSIAGGAAPVVMGEMAKPYLKEAGNVLKEALGAASDPFAKAVTATAPAAELGTAAAADGLATTAPGVASAVGEAAAGAGAVAAEAGAAGAMSTLGTAVPVIGAGLLVGKALGLFKDGGSVKCSQHGMKRINMEHGGKVSGPGGPRDDKVPAMLSNDEYVLPAKTTAALGGPEVLDPIVQATNDGRPPVPKDGGGNRYASGGLANLGITLGAGTQEYNRQQQVAENKRRYDEQHQLALNADARAANADTRTSKTAALQTEAAQMTLDKSKRAEAINEKIRADVANSAGGQLYMANKDGQEKYNAELAAWKAGDQTAPPPAPFVPQMPTPGMALDAMRIKAMHTQDPQDMTQWVSATKAARDESFNRVVRIGHYGASAEDIANEFNKAGTAKVRPEDIRISDASFTTPAGKTIKAREIEYADPDTGKVLKINTGREMQLLGDNDKALKQMLEERKVGALETTASARETTAEAKASGASGAGSGSGVQRERWDDKQLRSLVDDNASAFTFDSAMPDGKPQQSVAGRNLYLRLVRDANAAGADPAEVDQFMFDLRAKAKDKADFDKRAADALKAHVGQRAAGAKEKAQEKPPAPGLKPAEQKPAAKAPPLTEGATLRSYSDGTQDVVIGGQVVRVRADNRKLDTSSIGLR